MLLRPTPRLGLRIAAPALLCLLTAACQIQELRLPDSYAGPRPLPPDLAALLVHDPAADPPELEVASDAPGYRHLRGRLQVPSPDAAGADQGDGDSTRELVFELFEAKAALQRDGDGDAEPRPLVAVMPILEGDYPVARGIAELMTEAGWNAFFVHRPPRLLDLDNEPEEVERRLRGGVIAYRQVLDWLERHPAVDPERIGLIGVSLGAITCPMLAAVDDRIGPTVIVMGAGDIPGVLADSIEGGVHRYRIAHKDRIGVRTAEAFRADVERRVSADPLDFAPSVDARRVLQVISTLDNRVPTAYQWKLWEALGQPRGYAVPIGHYSAAVYVNWAKQRLLAFFAEQFEAPLPAAGAP